MRKYKESHHIEFEAIKNIQGKLLIIVGPQDNPVFEASVTHQL